MEMVRSAFGCLCIKLLTALREMAAALSLGNPKMPVLIAGNAMLVFPCE